ncbi:MAG: hypothetical protein Q7L07_02875 [Pseudohongiella sp.]|nr:hypothetical protein [Pseudohongiella sp.]MDP1756609.1 hypothetical protein [Pseudohongiella sp.]
MSLRTQGSSPVSWSAQAFNQVPDSDNRIHSDQIAKAYGFTGALVPGVTVSSYLIHPAVQAWGKKWLEHGAAHVSVKSPLYDERKFDVFVNAQGAGYEADLLSEGRQCAHASVSMTERLPPAPTLRGDTLIRADFVAPPVSRALMEALQISGCASMRYCWSADHEMASYLRVQQAMPALLRTDGQPGSGGFANIAFLLGCANRHFAAIARMSPWIHMETWSQNFHAVELGTELISEMKITRLFEKKGHEFADCEFNLFRAADNVCVCSIMQRAIYQLRLPGSHA